ncbi:MAG: GAF domain-containing protein [Microscillaceae bacterium]|jgi:GAF domain-containing protein/HAMP domain-containing protein|nr:GAF domain-containing protein [Microscillaceae bacterium]
MFRIKLTIRNSVFLQLLVISGLIIFNYNVGRQYDQDLSEVEKTVDLVESNGTYSLKIVFYTNLIMQGKEENRSKLNEAIDTYANNLRIIKLGGKNPENGAYIAPTPAELINGYLQPLENIWTRFYENANLIANKKIVLADGSLNPEVKDAHNYLLLNNTKLLDKNYALVKGYLDYFDTKQARRDLVLAVIFFINIALVILMWIYIVYNVVRPISKLNEIDAIINEGNYERNIEYTRDDELGKVARSINTLFQSLRNSTNFILAIGEGKLETHYQGVASIKSDRLGTALIEMRDKMGQVAESDRQRNWASEGLAKFAEIFRTYNQSEDFNYIIISNLVKYIEANQGGLFIVADQEQAESHLELVAAYAFEKRKYLTRKIEKGEGLIGEVYREGSTIYMTEIPESYVHITSGLGGANPRSLLLVPLKLNDVVYGVVELASFKPFEPYQVEFVEKLGESIASTFASVKNSVQTQKLLKESLQLSEQMRAQEEEMRQNLEELMATQEEVQRKNALIEEQKRELEKSLEEEQRRIVELLAERNNLLLKLEDLQGNMNDLEMENRSLRANMEKTLS